MKNRIRIVFVFLLFSSFAFSQSYKLIIQGSAGKFYVDHIVAAKENWYSIGRLYNAPPHDIAKYNNLSFDKALEIGQHLEIPLSAANFEQKQMKVSGESLIPLYHQVQEKEWAFKISSMYNDVPVTNLEKWNNIKRDDVKPGVNLIVGFLRVKTDLSPYASGSYVAATVVSSASSNTKPSTLSTQSSSNPPASAIPVSATTSSSTAGNDRVNNYATGHSNGGYFSGDFSSNGKSANGIAGTFKSTSGWNDGKYYALMNNVPVGTIIKVTSANGKVIYAKVLGQLPEMKESAGLVIRISNAASAELGLGEGKFPVDVKY